MTTSTHTKKFDLKESLTVKNGWVHMMIVDYTVTPNARFDRELRFKSWKVTNEEFEEFRKEVMIKQQHDTEE